MALKRTGGGSKAKGVGSHHGQGGAGIASAWANDVLHALTQSTDKVPDGWLTNRQLQGVWGLGVAQVNLLLAQGIRAGKVEMRKFRIRGLSGVIRPIPHYRFKT